MKHHHLHMSLFAFSLVCVQFAVPTLASAAEITDVGTVRISGEEDKLGNGLMIEEDGVKNKNTVTKSAIEKSRSSSNPFQLLNLQPGVNASSTDATGLFGGNLRVRGFNSDQMGFTINGAPVNDSGNFAVYPQEYTDSENLSEIFVTQGATDTDAPHVGASGGNVGIVSSGPKDKQGGKFAYSFGDLNYSRTFVRLDTGLMGTQMPIKAFVSFSKSYVNKFKGPGDANREHIDAGLDWKISKDTSFSASLLYNRAVNNNILTLSKRDWLANPNKDYSSILPQHKASGNENTADSFGASPAYYGYSLNPFENYLITSRLQTRVNDQLTLSAEPYFWYGYGTGGTQQTTLTENTSSGTRLGYGVGDINRNGIYTDTVGIYRGSVTKTDRPGITVKANYNIDNHKILAGYWIEKADHRQTQPATTVDNAGNIADLWLRDNLITLNNGQVYQGRDYITKSTGQSVFLLDTISLMKDKLQVIPGIRYTSIERDFTNHASSGFGLGADYSVNKTFSKALPSLGLTYKLTDTLQAYGNITQNMRAPANYELSGWTKTVSYVNGAPSTYTIVPTNSIKEETSTNYEVGTRFTGKDLVSSVALYQVDFKDRLAQSFNPETNLYSSYNVGGSQIKGLEMTIGTKVAKGWSLFGSATYTNSRILEDFNTTLKAGGAQTKLATSGKLFPDTPEWMFGASVQYTTGPYLAALSGKYVGKRYTTLMNDEWIDAYTTFDFNAGYKFQSMQYLKSPTIRLNVSNLLDERYLLANSGSGSSISATTSSAVNGGFAPSYYVGAPRFVSVTLSSEF